MYTNRNKGTKNKSKIKKIMTKMKSNIYDQFQLKGLIQNNQNSH